MGYDSRDETKVVATNTQGKNTSCYVSRNEPIIDERNRSELFHIRVISKHTKNDTLFFYSGSQANLILEEIVNKLQLETKLHSKPYPLGWVYDNAQLQVTKQCRLRFSITSGFVDEVDLQCGSIGYMRHRVG